MPKGHATEHTTEHCTLKALPELSAKLLDVLGKSFSELQQMAVCLGIKKEDVAWGKEGTPNRNKAEITFAIINNNFSTDDLKHIAIDLGIKKQGVGWGAHGTPALKKDELIAAVRSAKVDHIHSVCSLKDLHEIAVDKGIKREGVDWGTDGTPNNNKIDIILSIINKHFSLDELKRVAIEWGIKREGVGWGREGTPELRKETLASAIINKPSFTHHLEELAFMMGIKRRGYAEHDHDDDDATTQKISGVLAKDELQDLAAKMRLPKSKTEGKLELIARIKTNLKKMDDVPEKVPPADDIFKTINPDTRWSYTVEERLHFKSGTESYMTRDEYRTFLKKSGIEIERDQHVFHIIASKNGGPDHPDNYLYALGSSFNQSIADRHDDLCCFIAGKTKADKAVRRAMEAESLYLKDPEAHKNLIDRRGRPVPALYSQNPYNREAGRCLTGAELCTRAHESIFHAMMSR
eukprot:TRINITY_DN10730_c0_g1_i2.p1 TRINITY_DN10730_c0_g1~~TRINITY_DN10730_c0_g1_i2.p1  ORF type:complete len:464 (-),score=78.45 TRINITY_DN10730_c0_g1_i2:461-1852(-)